MTLDTANLHRNRIFYVPRAEERVPVTMYLQVRDWLLANDPDAEQLYSWSQRTLRPPGDAEHLAREIIWIILCAGRSAQSARTIQAKVWRNIEQKRPVVDAFGYRAKAEAIEQMWRERESNFKAMQAVLATESPEALVEWCGSLRFVGDDTRHQLCKNLGQSVCKPDIWLCRLAGIPDKPRRAVKYRFPACMALCRPLSEVSGDRIATVDSMLWLACNKGVLLVSSSAGAVSFRPKVITARSIMVGAPGPDEIVQTDDLFGGPDPVVGL